MKPLPTFVVAGCGVAIVTLVWTGSIAETVRLGVLWAVIVAGYTLTKRPG